MDSVFRDIRRKDRVLSCDAAWKLLERGEYGFLAMQGMNGYGYGIPLSYAMSVTGSLSASLAGPK